MPDTILRELHLEAVRRRGYLALCGSSVLVHAAIAAGEAPQGNWRAALVALLSALLLPAVLNRRVAVRQLDTLAVWSANIGAAYFVWDFSARGLGLGARESLVALVFLVVWFGLLPLRKAIVRGAALYAALIWLVSRQGSPDPVPLLYIGFLLFLIGQMTVAGRQVQQELSRTARYAGLALIDPLTGLLNRRALEQRLEEHYAAQAKGAGPELEAKAPARIGVLMVDIDLFKVVNDTHGHEVGDRVLVSLGHTLRACARTGDLVARWGGEEFVLLVAAGERQVLEQIGARIQRVLAENVGAETAGEAGLPCITVSIGAALSGEAGDAAALLNLADRRLYCAKDAGRDQMNMGVLDGEPLADETPQSAALELAASR